MVTLTVEIVVESIEKGENIIDVMYDEHVLFPEDKVRYAFGSFIPVNDTVEYFLGEEVHEV